jgi:hypothetical protein
MSPLDSDSSTLPFPSAYDELIAAFEEQERKPDFNKNQVFSDITALRADGTEEKMFQLLVNNVRAYVNILFQKDRSMKISEAIQ